MIAPDTLAELKRLVHPMSQRGEVSSCPLWFVGTVEAAAQSELLRSLGVPGEGGQPKSYTVTLNGRKVRVIRYTQRLVEVCFRPTRAEKAAETEALRRRRDERDALKESARLDAAAAALAEAIALQPKTEAEFRKAAEDSLWRAYDGAFRLSFATVHESGFYFPQLVIDEVRGHMHSAIWAIREAVVLHDRQKLRQPIDDLRQRAAKLDAPLQRFLQAATRDVPPGLADEQGASNGC